MKRTIDCVANYTRSKVKRLKFDNGGYYLFRNLNILPKSQHNVTPTSVHNYFFKDTCVDWIKCNKISKVKKTPSPTSSNSAFNWIFEQGKEFERQFVNRLSQKYIISVGGQYYSEEGYNRTLDMMLRGVEIIHSACVKNVEKGYYGIADLLVRSDIFDKEFMQYTDRYITSFSHIHDHHYVVVEIKNKRFKIGENCQLPSRTCDILAYKSQLYIYTLCLNYMQNIDNPKAYFVGKSYSYKKHIFDSITYNKIPTTNFDTTDSNIPPLTEKAVKWVRDVKQNYYLWSINPPTNELLYPNMKSRYNMSYYSEKLKIATNIGEITMIMYCGLKQRNLAFDNGVYSWKDPLLTAEMMGFRDKKARLLNSIIDINRKPSPPSGEIYKYYKAPENLHLWDNTTIYLDIETFGGMVYMIGFVYQYKYFNFFIDNFSPQGEKQLLQSFQNFIRENHISDIYHHSGYDPITLKTKYKKYNIGDIPLGSFWSNPEGGRVTGAISGLEEILWHDTWSILYNCELVVKGLFDYKLKNIWKVLHSLRLISTSGEILKDCCGGLDSMNLAYKLFNNQGDGVELRNTLIRYNEFDCNVLKDLVSFLRRLD